MTRRQRLMRAAWYESQGEARNVLVVGTMEDPVPGPGEVRIAVQRSGINPGDVKKRSDAFGVGMPYPRVIPHSDGSGIIDAVGEGVSSGMVGERVWCFGAQSYRPFGTAADFTVVPVEQVMRLPANASWDQGACLGIPGITAHRAVHVGGEVTGRTVLVQGGAGAVGVAAVAIARHAGARVIATVRSEADVTIAHGAGADAVLRTDGLSPQQVVERVLALSADGVDHVVEVAFQANVAVDEQVLRLGGSIASYATNRTNPEIPFWNLAFKNARLFFLGSDDFPATAKRQAAADLSAMLAHGWSGFPVGSVLPLDAIATAHELVEQGRQGGRVLLDLTGGAVDTGSDADGRHSRAQGPAKAMDD